MESLAVFLVKNIVGAGVLFLFYILVLRGRKFHRYNRFYLLGVLVVSLLLPLINLRLYSFNLPKTADSVNDAILTGYGALPVFSAREIVLFACGAISMLMMVCLLLKILWVYKMMRSHEVQRMDGYYFIESGLKEAPFTFLDKLFWRKTISLKEDAGQKIFAHELAHIREKHTYDKLFSQFLLCFFWMNPFYWFIQRELNIIHEFLADAKSIQENDVASFAEMLLRSHNDGSYLDPVHPFYNSSVKRRLDMITRPGEPGNNYNRRLSALPIAVFMVGLFSFSLADIENDAALSIPSAKKATLKPHVTEKAKETYQQETDQKNAKHSWQDKLAGVEKRAELQKPATVNKDKPQPSKRKPKDDFGNSAINKKDYVKPPGTKESLKPVEGPGKKPQPQPAR